MIIGYGTVWIIGRQQIDFVVSATSLLLLNDAPKVSGKKLYKSEVQATDNEVPRPLLLIQRKMISLGKWLQNKLILGFHCYVEIQKILWQREQECL
jgi:hypothetical protein